MPGTALGNTWPRDVSVVASVGRVLFLLVYLVPVIILWLIVAQQDY
jgi:hypothetical protein